MFLIYQALKARRENLEVFRSGGYLPLEVTGKFQDNVIAFARSYGDKIAITIAPRFFTSLIQPTQYPFGQEIWHDTCLKLPKEMPSTWYDTITEQKIHARGSLLIAEVLQQFPVGLLVS